MDYGEGMTNPTNTFTVTLTADEADRVLRALDTAAHGMVADSQASLEELGAVRSLRRKIATIRAAGYR